MVQIINQHKPIAKKEHKCDYCGFAIEIGEAYDKTFISGDGVYTWKSHIKCGLLANKLSWFEYYDDGITHEAFVESIGEEYANIMSKHFTADWESLDFRIPSLKDRLNFIMEFHKI